MTEPVTVPTAPALATVPDVELMQAGTWALSTGEATFTVQDIANAVAALDCPAVRRPVLKLGHVDARFDGEPAVGWIANMRTNSGGDVLVGDYAGLPAWLGDVIASAYPDRSIEGAWNHTCQLGHTHPFVINAVALLGVSAPGVGTLTSLQDIGALYGVAASTQPASTFRLTASGGRMPAPPRTVAAQTSTEDVRRAYYDGPAANSWDWWIQAVYLDPPQLIVCNDADGHLYRVGYSVAGDAVTFDDPVRVRIEYVDAPEPSPMTAASAPPRPAAVYASRGDSRPQHPRPAEPAAGTTTPPDQEDHVSDALSEGLRQRLGIATDATDEDILAALDQQLDAVTDPTPPPPAVPEGSVIVPAPALADLQAQAAAGARAAEQLRVQDRDALITSAVNAGKIPPARRKHWAAAYDHDPDGTRDYLASAPQIVPIAAAGYTGGDDTTADDALYAGLFGDEKKASA